MGKPLAKDQTPPEDVYEFVCVGCGGTEFLTLTSHSQVPLCRCGSPLSRIAVVRDPSADPETRGETLPDGFGEESESLHYRYEGPCLVQGRAGYPEEVTDEEPEYGPLDHPHVGPRCQFCAIRQQRPSLHRLWCAVFFLRECNCGYERA